MTSAKRGSPARERIWRSTTLLFLLGSTLLGQGVVETPFDRLVRLKDNFHELREEISLDRTRLYFPGETGTITMKLANPTSLPLEIPDPKDPGTQGFDLLMRGGPFTKPGSEWSTPQYRVGPPPFSVASTLIQPGQTVTWVIRTEDKAVRPFTDRGIMPSAPGTYRLYYRLGGFVEFEVGEPVLESGTLVPLHKFQGYTDDDGKRVSSPQAAVLLATQLGKEHVLAISAEDIPAHHTIETDSDGVVTAGTISPLCPWIRLATIPFKVTSLKVSVSPTDLISIEYAGSGGARGTLRLDANRHPIN